jgi:hypothetical protein
VIRQRMHLRTPALVMLTRALTLLLAAILIWYGAMLVLLAAKVSAHTVNSLSAYRTIYDWLAKLRVSDFSTNRRLVAGFGGFLAFLLLVYLALQELPRPYLARHDVPIAREPDGSLTVEPRAFERLAEIAACSNGDVSSSLARLEQDSLTLDIGVRSAYRVAETLTDVRRRVLGELQRHELPELAVNVTVTKFEPTTGRNLA